MTAPRKPTDHITPRQARFLLEAAREGMQGSIASIAERAGVNRWTFYSWQRKSTAFARAWKELPAKMLERQMPRVMAAAIERAIAGSDQLALGLIKQGCGETVDLRVRGQLDHKHEHVHTIDLSKLSDDQVVTLEQILSTARAGNTVAERPAGKQAAPIMGNDRAAGNGSNGCSR